MPATAVPAAHALMALMLLLGARMPARTDANGDLVPLAQQDRGRWQRTWIVCGFEHFRLSIGGDRLTAYHCEAAIASVHAAAPSYAATDWPRIVREYDRLLQLAPSPVVRLNRAVAVGKVDGPDAGLRALAGLENDRALDDYFLLGAVTAQLHWERGDHDAAITALQQAIAQPCSAPERRLLARRLAACHRREPVPPW
jgi:RNA polymerase sigma-70 factor (ECF subfamily)